jgi:hypothetical protein
MISIYDPKIAMSRKNAFFNNNNFNVGVLEDSPPPRSISQMTYT